MRSLAETNKKRARPAERLTTFANISASSPITRSSLHARSTSSTTNTNCWPATEFDTARVMNAIGCSPLLGWMPNADRPAREALRRLREVLARERDDAVIAQVRDQPGAHERGLADAGLAVEQAGAKPVGR